jgi:hypothetical protein
MEKNLRFLIYKVGHILIYRIVAKIKWDDVERESNAMCNIKYYWLLLSMHSDFLNTLVLLLVHLPVLITWMISKTEKSECGKSKPQIYNSLVCSISLLLLLIFCSLILMHSHLV